MFRQMLRSKIHRVKVTDACLEYEGSLTVDETLLEAAGILPYEAVVISNLNNGERFTTYAIAGPRDSGTVSLNGPLPVKAPLAIESSSFVMNTTMKMKSSGTSHASSGSTTRTE